MAKKSRVPTVVGAIPVVGDLARRADNQAGWVQELVEQNARLIGQLPATLKAFNDSLERLGQTVARLDRVVTRVESVTNQLIGPLEEFGPRLDRVREIPELVDTLRREALPALRAATTTQNQVAVLSSTLDRAVGVLGVLNDLPGAGLVRRIADAGGEFLGEPRSAGIDLLDDPTAAAAAPPPAPSGSAAKPTPAAGSKRSRSSSSKPRA